MHVQTFHPGLGPHDEDWLSAKKTYFVWLPSMLKKRLTRLLVPGITPAKIIQAFRAQGQLKVISPLQKDPKGGVFNVLLLNNVLKAFKSCAQNP